MAGKAKDVTDYTPFRVVEESYQRDPRPQNARLAHAAGRAVMDVMLNESLVSRRKPAKAEPLDVASRHNPRAGRVFGIEGATIRHPMQARRYTTFWGLPLERSKLVEPEDLAVSVVEALRRTFTGTQFWDNRKHLFSSGVPDVGYNDLAIRLAEAGAIQPAELNAKSFGEYITRVGGQALLSVTGAPEVGGTQIFPHTYSFVPKAQELRLRETP